MLRIPHLLLLALLALALGAAPAFAAAPSGAPSARVATDDPGDEWGDEGEDPGDEECDDDCWEDDDSCYADDDGDWEGWAEAASASTAGDEDEWEDEDPGDDWGDDEDWDDECDEEVVAPPVVSTLRATPARGGRLRVQFQLDRAGGVTLALQRIGGKGKASRSCAKHARAAKRRAQPRRSCAPAPAPAPTGTVSLAGRSGANATTLRRWNGRRLAPGSYKLTATPEGEGGHDASTTFTLRAPARRR